MNTPELQAQLDRIENGVIQIASALAVLTQPDTMTEAESRMLALKAFVDDAFTSGRAAALKRKADGTL